MRQLVILLLVMGGLATSQRADAYPFFQFTTGSSRCAQCHVSPAGGGLLTAWGRDESADSISRGGNGSFLHGAVALPDSLSLGGDVRFAALANEVGATEGTELAAFPMQIDVAAAVKATEDISVVAIVGARGRVRSGAPDSMESDASKVEAPSLASYVISREHYLMWRASESEGVYVRAGRFAAPYGLRLADHTAYVRRYLGSNLQEETYGLGVGWLGELLEAHITGFVHDPLQGSGRDEVGGALLVEAQANGLAVGASTRVGVASTSTRAQAGVFGKLLLGDALLVQAEVDGVRELFDGPGDRWQLATYAGPTWVAARGVYVGAAYQAFAEDLRVRSVLRQGLDAFVSYFPIAHVELMANARAQRIGPQEHAYLAMLQIHYYL